MISPTYISFTTYLFVNSFFPPKPHTYLYIDIGAYLITKWTNCSNYFYLTFSFHALAPKYALTVFHACCSKTYPKFPTPTELMNKFFKICDNDLGEYCWYIFQPKMHDHILIASPLYHKHFLMPIFLCNFNLVIPEESISK
jgi:hypothetical protein